ncbi:aminoacyl-histidine dipeptidase [Clostridium botulinum]|uniref:Cytosol non-specific dipeptidase n=1 Tax=Clostridium botulinum (strain Eklund 17B / Type B) TaxID=935198 RepID=B2TK51_CLOBB|nr:aminoacyl-histidine dipeptidase [Clostridium botulinum B str. Eklund 17B (NRP)]MBY6976436.1 aminoacyl-histidine dipeptidase [Clostridium botulinum]MBY7001632.1 aminoacyl-histidine dipeptidase [Clostridium botulinum]MCR1274466.1 aminoacyl-histidine dipeptidase [Clostridium botulinum]NFD69144.1 aminoacyl-histidine dipeptidase [Clostridium botulinum]
MRKFKQINCEKVFYYFNEISRIPRGSGNEKGISDYLLNFGKDLGLEAIQDDALNIIIKKPASPGYEKSPTVIIQGHMDMVCEKNNEKVHDFTKDPIELVTKDDFIYANGTTLGADDGIAVAYAMAILEDNTIEHPAIEVLLTSDEEAGMSGAMALKSGCLDGKIVINLDSEDEGKLLVSCAGGIRTKSILNVQWENTPKNKKAFKLIIKGLSGGHSGSDIHLGRGNSNKLIGRVLKNILNQMELNLVSLNGGSKNNAIPREATAELLIDADMEKEFLNIISTLREEFKNEFRVKDANIQLEIEELKENIEKVFSKESTDNVINLLYLYPNGINTVSSDIEGLTESSTNIGVLTTKENHVEYDSAVRSSVFSLREEIVERIRCLTEILGGTVSNTAGYPEWQYKEESKIREICKDVYKQMYNEEAEVVAIHAGVECGLFKEKLGDLDMISFGPDIFDAHTPNEHMSISSVERVWSYLLEVLKEIK